jgi:magnesium-transporting ATPase (P-type)
VGKIADATVLSGSTVTAGHGTAPVVGIGTDSHSSRLTEEAGAWREALISTLASASSVIPQGLILMISISFALAAAKRARSPTVPLHSTVSIP